jgi:acetylglutamate kinase
MKEKLKVIKIGGEIINDKHQLNEALKRFAVVKEKKILVHGGGKLASELSRKLGIKPRMLEGRRLTSQEDLDIVTMVYAGLINKKIVANLQQSGCNALGLSGADANVILSEKRPVKEIDYGLVGDISGINNRFINMLLTSGIAPVFCAITHDKMGQLLNTNADTVASEVAVAMSNLYETELVYCFDKKGVLRDITDSESVIKKIDNHSYTELVNDGVINAGMLPKLKKGFHALEHKVSKVIIGNAAVINNEQELFTLLTI